MNEARETKSHRRQWAFLVIPLVMLVYCLVGLTGIRWGLPSQKRSDLYDAQYGEVVGSGTDRLFVTGPLQSYQVDECSALMPLARMRPRELDFNPRWFHWGSLHLYITGAALLVAEKSGVVTLTTEKSFYLEQPEEMAKIYLIGRIVVWIFGLGCVVLFIGLLRRVLARLELVLFLSLAFVVAPLFGLYSRFATPDVPLLFWVLAASYLAGVGRSCPTGKRWLVGAYCTAGFAASTKFYGGLALVFPIWYTLRQRNAAKLIVMGLVLFVAAFVIGTPYALLDWRRFISDLAWQWNHVERGHGDAFLGTSPSLVYHWLESLPAGLAPLGTVIVAAGVAWVVFNKKERDALLPVLGFLLLFWIQITRSPLKFSRYLLPIVPFHLMLAGRMLQELWERRRVRIVVTIVGAVLVLSEAVLMATHLEILTRRDVRDVAGSWLDANGEYGDTVLFSGRPYFSSPPVSSRKFAISAGPVTREYVATFKPDWIILTDYDMEPARRAPEQRSSMIEIWHLLDEAAPFGPEGVSYRRHTFTARYEPPTWACWGQRFLPHDLRYHCPEIWVFERAS
jgi:hypothetical protein